MNKTRILAIDDDVIATRMVRLRLERTGRYVVRELNDPTRALAVAREFRPDLVLLDVCLPDIEGGDVAFELQSDRHFERTPILFLTSMLSEEETKGNCVLAGGYRFVAKPPRGERLVDCIESALAAAGSGEQRYAERECS